MQSWTVDGFIRSIKSTSVLDSQRGNSRKAVNRGYTGICSHTLACRVYMLIINAHVQSGKNSFGLMNSLKSPEVKSSVNILISGTV